MPEGNSLQAEVRAAVKLCHDRMTTDQAAIGICLQMLVDDLVHRLLPDWEARVVEESRAREHADSPGSGWIPIEDFMAREPAWEGSKGKQRLYRRFAKPEWGAFVSRPNPDGRYWIHYPSYLAYMEGARLVVPKATTSKPRRQRSRASSKQGSKRPSDRLRRVV